MKKIFLYVGVLFLALLVSAAVRGEFTFQIADKTSVYNAQATALEIQEKVDAQAAANTQKDAVALNEATLTERANAVIAKATTKKTAWNTFTEKIPVIAVMGLIFIGIFGIALILLVWRVTSALGTAAEITAITVPFMKLTQPNLTEGKWTTVSNGSPLNTLMAIIRGEPLPEQIFVNKYAPGATLRAGQQLPIEGLIAASQAASLPEVANALRGPMAAQQAEKLMQITAKTATEALTRGIKQVEPPKK